MSYLVLARKWRPRRFSELVGQEHVVKALTNALESGRVHHAFLFTGTRGVGKTTIARIFAKSLNCERGAGAEPCGECAACLDIDAGRFVDLLEIDAASNTGVDDVRALIENAQYMPARGRTKVYLIDEVHMLSKSAFNALLKTLEEPPGHVKFLLATTDPQKLPVTVLSRCLQFNLRRLEPEQIEQQMARILAAEGIAFDPGALQLLARSADGSLRDGLSLLDQAIAHTGSAGGGRLDEAGVNAMLGTVERARVGEMLAELAAGDAAGLMREVGELAQYSPDYGQLLEDLATELHRVQLHQLVPGFSDEGQRVDAAALAARLSPEVVQLWFQMALNGRRDLGLAPSARAGLEMTLLRMLAFRPAAGEAETTARASQPAPARQAPPPAASAASATAAVAPPPARPVPAPPPPAVLAPEAATAPPPPAPIADAAPMPLASADDWLALVAAAGLKGPVLQLGSHCLFCGYADGVLRLHLPEEDAHLRNDSLVRQLAGAASQRLGTQVQLRFEPKPAQAGDTLHKRNERQRTEIQNAAEASFLADPVVAQLLGQGGSIVPDSIRPLSEN
jgi:DNA polymerase-3 subunit gamma/tau